jgi:hypothetical protein
MFANSRCSNVPSHGPFVWDTRKALSARMASQGDRPTPTRTVEASQVSKASRNGASVSRRNSLMLLPEFARSTALRWTFLLPGLVTAFIVAVLEFI